MNFDATNPAELVNDDRGCIYQVHVMVRPLGFKHVRCERRDLVPSLAVSYIVFTTMVPWHVRQEPVSPPWVYLPGISLDARTYFADRRLRPTASVVFT